MPSITQARKQHTTPRFHLENWANERGQILTFDSESQKIFPQNVLNACTQRDYYNLENEVLDHPIEEVLSEEVEGPAKASMDKLNSLSFSNFTEEDRKNVAIYLAFQTVRTPFMHGKWNKVAEQNAIERVEKILHDPEKYEEFLKDYPGDRSIDPEKILEGIKDKSLSPKVKDNDYNLKAMFLVASPVAESLEKCRWTILVANEGRQFICTDNPCVTISELTPQGRRTEVIMPLSPTTCLLIDKNRPHDGYRFERVGQNDVREINRRLALHSERFIFAQNESLLKSIGNFRIKQSEDIRAIKENMPNTPLEREMRMLTKTLSRPAQK